MIFWYFELFKIPHTEKYFHVDQREENLRYSVSKLGNEITSTQNQEISKKNKSNVFHQKMRNVVVLRISVVFNKMKSKAQLSESHRKVAQAFVFIPQNFKAFCNTLKVMHQSIPPTPSAPPPPPGATAGICPPCQSRGWGICKAFANPGAIPELLTRTRFPIRI